MPAQPLFQFRAVALNPTPDGRVIRLRAALSEQLFDIAQRKRVPKIRAHRTQHQLRRRLPPLENCRSGCALHDLFSLPASPAKVATHRLEQQPAGVALGDRIRHLHVEYRAAAPFGAYKFPRATSCRICFSSASSATSRTAASSRARNPSAVWPGRASARHTPCATDRRSAQQCLPRGRPVESSGPCRSRPRPAPKLSRSLPPCICVMPFPGPSRTNVY